MCLANGNEESIKDVLSGYVSDFFGESEQNTHKNGGAAFENSEKIAKTTIIITKIHAKTKTISTCLNSARI